MLRLFMSALQVHAAEGNGKPFRPRQALLVRLAIGAPGTASRGHSFILRSNKAVFRVSFFTVL